MISIKLSTCRLLMCEVNKTVTHTPPHNFGQQKSTVPGPWAKTCLQAPHTDMHTHEEIHRSCSSKRWSFAQQTVRQAAAGGPNQHVHVHAILGVPAFGRLLSHPSRSNPWVLPEPEGSAEQSERAIIDLKVCPLTGQNIQNSLKTTGT